MAAGFVIQTSWAEAPTHIEWMVIAGYLLTSGLCIQASLSRQRRFASEEQSPAVWWTVASLVLFLGINKALQLQTLFIHVGREAAMAHGWIESRRTLQQLFILVLFLVAGGVGSVFVWHYRQFSRQHLTLIGGVVLVLAYSLFRAAEMNHVELLGVGRSTSDALWPLEVAGVALMLFGVTKHFVASRSAQAASTIPQ